MNLEGSMHSAVSFGRFWQTESFSDEPDFPAGRQRRESVVVHGLLGSKDCPEPLRVSKVHTNDGETCVRMSGDEFGRFR